MQQHHYLAVTYMGKYQQYILADITGILTDSKLNIVAVEQNSLLGLSIVMLIAETLEPEDTITKARGRLLEQFRQSGLDVRVEIVSPQEADVSGRKKLQVFTIVGRDRVGILKAITNTLANFRVRIERMNHIAKGELVVLELWVDASELRDLAVLKEVIQSTCDREGFDVIIQPESPFRQRRRLVVFDMDNTIIEGEIIDELAKAAKVGERVSSITERAMAGELDFEQALRERVTMLKGLSEETLEDVAESMNLTEGAEEVVRTLKGMGFKLALISGGFTFFANRLKERLGFDHVYANHLEIVDGIVTGDLEGEIIDKEAKGRILGEIAAKEGVTKEEIVAIGDGANDEIMLRNAGFGIAFNANQILKKIADGQLTRNNLSGLLYCLGATERTIQDMAESL